MKYKLKFKQNTKYFWFLVCKYFYELLLTSLLINAILLSSKMPIIMTYHTLVERDARFVPHKWRISIITLLTGIAICNSIAGFKIHFLDRNFEDNCFINSRIVFKKMRDYSNESHFIRIASGMEFNTQDHEFFESVEIDRLDSYWGNQTDCNFVSITPLFFCFCAVIWITLLITFGHGGKSKAFTVEAKAWIIVIPALVFFIAAAIATFVLLMFLKSAIDMFCLELNKHLHGEYYCGFLLEQFSLLDQEDVKFSRGCYATILQSLILANVMWALAALIMVLRIIFAIDFQLVRVTISTIEPKKNEIKNFDNLFNNMYNVGDDDSINPNAHPIQVTLV